MTSPLQAPAGTTEYPAVSIYEADGSVCALTMYVNNVSRDVVGWHLVNNLPYPVQGDVSEGAFSASQIFQPGEDVQGTVPKNRQWNYDDGGSMSYGLYPRR